MGAGQLSGQPFVLRYFAPATDLRGLISSYYLFHAASDRVSDLLRADFAQLRFMIAGRGVYGFDGAAGVVAPDVSLVGPTMAASRFDVAGPVTVFGISLHPLGWAMLIRDDASRYADAVGDAAAMFGPIMIDALDAMRNAGAEAALAKIADIVVRSLIRHDIASPAWFTTLADEWLTGDVDPDVDRLVDGAGVSARHVERLARRLYGGPPKLLARKYRALRAASLIGVDGLAWTDAVGDAFYDQSHFIREFKRFTGQTPRQFERDPTPLTRLTLQRRVIATGLTSLAQVS